MRAWTVLGIETSCDETAAAVVRGAGSGPAAHAGPGEILSNIVFSQLEEHRPYGGVVPEIASRNHYEVIDLLTRRALKKSRRGIGEIDITALTLGPGLMVRFDPGTQLG